MVTFILVLCYKNHRKKKYATMHMHVSTEYSKVVVYVFVVDLDLLVVTVKQ